MTTPATERNLRPIRIPLLRGLLGYRVLVIADAREPSVARIHSLKGLATLTAVQGTGWPDVRVLRANGLTVVTAPDYRGLFRMVAAGHADYFPPQRRRGQCRTEKLRGAWPDDRPRPRSTLCGTDLLFS